MRKSPIQKEDLPSLSEKLVKEWKSKVDADALIVLAFRNGMGSEIHTSGMCHHDILMSAQEILQFGIDEMQKEGHLHE